MSRPRQPWAMKWIVLAIVAVIIPYTYLTLHYRRPEKAFQPYVDIKDRANTLRLLSGGFQRIPLSVQRLADPVQPAALTAKIAAGPGGLPAALRDALVDEPLLPVDVSHVSALPNAMSAEPYLIRFAYSGPDDHHEFGSAHLYVRNGEIFLVPNFEKIGGELIGRSRQNEVALTVSAGAMKPGDYRVTLVAQHASQSWTLQVH